MAMRKALEVLLLGALVWLQVTSVLGNDPDLTNDFGISKPVVQNFTFTGFRNLPDAPPHQATRNPQNLSNLPGLTGLGLNSVEFVFGPYSQIDPHYHPRATELANVLEGTVDVGFVDTSNVLFATTLFQGDLFVFPKGTLHFLRNNQKTGARVYSVLSSENPGAVFVANALFNASGVGLPDNVLTTAFKTNEDVVLGIKKAEEGKTPSKDYPYATPPTSYSR